MLIQRGGSCRGFPPPVLGAKSACHGRGACAAGGGAPTRATRSRLAALSTQVSSGSSLARAFENTARADVQAPPLLLTFDTNGRILGVAIRHHGKNRISTCPRSLGVLRTA